MLLLDKAPNDGPSGGRGASGYPGVAGGGYAGSALCRVSIGGSTRDVIGAASGGPTLGAKLVVLGGFFFVGGVGTTKRRREQSPRTLVCEVETQYHTWLRYHAGHDGRGYFSRAYS